MNHGLTQFEPNETNEAVTKSINNFFADQSSSDVRAQLNKMYEAAASNSTITDNDKNDFKLYINNTCKLLYILESIASPFM